MRREVKSIREAVEVLEQHCIEWRSYAVLIYSPGL